MWFNRKDFPHNRVINIMVSLGVILQQFYIFKQYEILLWTAKAHSYLITMGSLYGAVQTMCKIVNTFIILYLIKYI